MKHLNGYKLVEMVQKITKNEDLVSLFTKLLKEKEVSYSDVIDSIPISNIPSFKDLCIDKTKKIEYKEILCYYTNEELFDFVEVDDFNKKIEILKRITKKTNDSLIPIHVSIKSMEIDKEFLNQLKNVKHEIKNKSFKVII